ncbi:MAG TPA: hypothetical protein VFQ90_03580 [Stellaceae bacterium]|jgi:hypothetical protein|nr:hypothetical protein [Stellaceae bacterium]
MRGSRISNPIIMAATAVALAGLLAPILAVHAADLDQPPAPGQPIVLFSPDSPAPPNSGLTLGAGVTTPTKQRSTPVKRMPLDGNPLIPPAPPAAKLGPPPAARPALSLETDLQPLTTPPAPPAGASNPAAAKAPSS